MNKWIVLIFLVNSLFPLISRSACSFENLTAQSLASSRKVVYQNMENLGVRLAWQGMKEVNNEGIGKINKVISGFEKKICDSFDSEIKKYNLPNNIHLKINKMDFKGYYITCRPMPQCLEQIEKISQQIPAEKIPNPKNIKNTLFHLIASKAKNYQEGYIKVKAISTYPDYKDPLSEFIDKKLQAALKLATGHTDLSQINGSDSLFLKRLRENVALMRSGKIDQVAKNMKPLVLALDNLLEIPFVSSNNLEQELKAALDPKVRPIPPEKILVTSAVSGDDLFVIVKNEKGKVLKIVGADARGLGVTNMETRYSQLIRAYKGNGITSTKDILTLSNRAIYDADKKMATSLDKYRDNLIKNLKNVSVNNIDQAVEAAHRTYHSFAVNHSDYMQMRSAAISNCVPKNQCILDSITAIHKLLKEMEKRGINGHFGDSCLGVEYWIHKLKIR